MVLSIQIKKCQNFERIEIRATVFLKWTDFRCLKTLCCSHQLHYCKQICNSTNLKIWNALQPGALSNNLYFPEIFDDFFFLQTRNKVSKTRKNIIYTEWISIFGYDNIHSLVLELVKRNCDKKAQDYLNWSLKKELINQKRDTGSRYLLAWERSHHRVMRRV